MSLINPQRYLLILFVVVCFSCKKNIESHAITISSNKNIVTYAKGFEIYPYDTFSILKITKPWPNATQEAIFILKNEKSQIPDSLKNIPFITVPLQRVIATSTTHIPSLEALGVENTLIGFPNTDYISSIKTRKRIDNGFVKEVGANESLNVEQIINLKPDAIIGFGIDGQNPIHQLLQKSGQQIIFNGDWVEQTPLGKAEWIKFFGVLYGKSDEANQIFKHIESEYLKTKALLKKETSKSTVLSGTIFQDVWYLPQGNSWASVFISDAHGDYLWKNTSGTGSLSLSFESVLEKAQNADFWIGTDQYTSLQEMKQNNPHYTQFKAFKNKQVYSYGTRKGAKGGFLFYELAPNRPDLVLKDIVKILHPDLIPDYELFFYKKLE